MTYPFVTVIIPMRNEEKFIASCLDSVLANDYPADRFEVLVVDGGSTDGSRDIVAAYERGGRVRLLDNPRGYVSPALNLGIQEARGDIIVRMDAHAKYAPDYIRQCVYLLQHTDAANVGGVQRAVGNTYVARGIALAVSSRFAAGDAKYRYADKEMWVDTVFLGAWWKRTLFEIGGFNNRAVVNQDFELNYRLRQAGYKILLSPRIRCEYYVRGSLAKLATQYFRYGQWKVNTLVLHPGSLRWRQLAAPALVMALLVSMVVLPLNFALGLIVPVSYLSASIVASLIVSANNGGSYFPIVLVAFWTIHISWGIGFITGLFRFGVPGISSAGLARN